MNLSSAMRQLIKILIGKTILPAMYWLFSALTTIDEHLVIFADSNSSILPYSMDEAYKAVTRAGYRVEIHCADYRNNLPMKISASMVRFMKSYAKARYVFICNYFLPASSCKKRAGTTVIQLWHASGALKKFGYDAHEDVPRIFAGNPFRNWDFVTVSSPACVEFYQRATKISANAILPIGTSRTDKLFDPEYLLECRRDFFRQYPQFSGKKIVLWAPTFRGRASAPWTPGVETIKNLGLCDRWGVVSKLHPHMPKQDGLFQPDIPTERLLPIADLLITDYSSVLLEFALFNKPIIMFTPDYKQYSESRGIYMPLDEIPVIHVSDSDDLPRRILSCESSYDYNAMRDFTRKYMSSCDGCSTSRIIQNMKTSL